jgi:hypothetical protein
MRFILKKHRFHLHYASWNPTCSAMNNQILLNQFVHPESKILGVILAIISGSLTENCSNQLVP